MNPLKSHKFATRYFSTAVIAIAIGLAMPAIASAHTFVWSCNSDGYFHLVADGVEYTMNQPCSPASKLPGAVEGQAFLDSGMKGGTPTSQAKASISTSRSNIKRPDPCPGKPSC